MTPRHRMALFLSVAFLAVALGLNLNHLVAKPVPGRKVQLPEPPLGDVPPPPPIAEVGCPIDPPTPTVAIRVRVPACIAVGQEVEYRIFVENTSRAAAHHVVVRNPLPPNARFVKAKPEPSTRTDELVWAIGTLEPCECREICLCLSPTGDGDVKNCARVSFEHGQCVCTRIARPELKLCKQGPTEAALYDSLTFALVVTNTGAAPATGVTLTDNLPEGLEHSSGKPVLTWDVGTLAPGQEKRVEYQVIAKKTGEWRNLAVATAAGGLKQEASTVVTVGEPRIELKKTGPERRFVNRPATYQLTVTNPGTMALANVAISDPVPAKMAFVSATEGGQLVEGRVQWTIGALPAGAKKTVQVVLRAKDTGEIVNKATATADRGLTVEAEAKTIFEGGTGLTMDVDDKEDPVPVGGDTTYTIAVLNQGKVPATKVVITVTIPEQMELKSAKGPADYKKDGRKLVFEPLTIEGRNEVIYEVVVKALRAGDVRFAVDLSADPATLPSGLPVHREESTTIFDPNVPTTPPVDVPAVPQKRVKKR